MRSTIFHKRTRFQLRMRRPFFLGSYFADGHMVGSRQIKKKKIGMNLMIIFNKRIDDSHKTGNSRKEMSGKAVCRVMPELSSLSWCIQHHHLER